jgi:hypothetical protein
VVSQDGVNNKVHLLLADFSVVHLKYFSHVIVYLSRVGHEQLKNKLAAECTTGTIIISVGVCVNIFVFVVVVSNTSSVSSSVSD